MDKNTIKNTILSRYYYYSFEFHNDKAAILIIDKLETYNINWTLNETETRLLVIPGDILLTPSIYRKEIIKTIKNNTKSIYKYRHKSKKEPVDEFLGVFTNKYFEEELTNVIPLDFYLSSAGILYSKFDYFIDNYYVKGDILIPMFNVEKTFINHPVLLNLLNYKFHSTKNKVSNIYCFRKKIEPLISNKLISNKLIEIFIDDFINYCFKQNIYIIW